MCGRYSLEFDDGFYQRFKVVNKPEIKSRYNISPSQKLPVVVSQSPNTIELMVWGLVPFWEEKKEKPHGLINIRDDTVINKSWPHKYLQAQRCLVPATGFYEWQKTTDIKIPYYFYLKNQKYFSFAGIYSVWNNSRTYSIITTRANEVMAPIHNRMPVILKEEDEDVWLQSGNPDLSALKQLLVPYQKNDLLLRPVSLRVNSPLNDDKSLIKIT